MFKKPTRVFEEIIKGGRTAMVALPDFTPLQGGVPIIVNGQVVGAIGVSGAASAQQDEEIAMAGAQALAGSDSGSASGSSSQVWFFDRQRVAEAFARGTPLFDGVQAGPFRVNPSRRDAPGDVEVHTAETDIMYVQDGAATLITGGRVVDPKMESGEEVRAARIEGGDTHHLAKGDVIVIPRNVPHWFKEVTAPFVYYVVKVRG
jgi:glc operon protein GlcG